MGERKGQNKYYPPDFDWRKHGNLNRYHGTHALRERASKIGQGVLIIRFEMPFNVWCLGCKQHVGMGVRYNAEKKKVGMYYTTPIYEFRMKCTMCDTYYVIRTDPKNYDYELVEGLKRQEKRWDPSELDGSAPIDRSFQHKLAADAMFKVAHQHKDKEAGSSSEAQLDRLEWLQERLRDDYTANRVLRASFRREKTQFGERRAADADLKSRLSLDALALAPASDDDRKLASMLVRYRHVRPHDQLAEEQRRAVEERPILGGSHRDDDPDAPGPSTSAPSSSSASSSTAAGRLASTLRISRTVARSEQFSRGKSTTTPPAMMAMVRRKRKSTKDDEVQLENEEDGEERKDVKPEKKKTTTKAQTSGNALGSLLQAYQDEDDDEEEV